MRASLYFSKEKWRCPVPVLLLFKGLILTVLGVLGECRVHNRPGLCSQLSTTNNAVGAGKGEGELYIFHNGLFKALPATDLPS